MRLLLFGAAEGVVVVVSKLGRSLSLYICLSCVSFGDLLGNPTRLPSKALVSSSWSCCPFLLRLSYCFTFFYYSPISLLLLLLLFGDPFARCRSPVVSKAFHWSVNGKQASTYNVYCTRSTTQRAYTRLDSFGIYIHTHAIYLYMYINNYYIGWYIDLYVSYIRYTINLDKMVIGIQISRP